MASYIIKSKNIKLNTFNGEQISIGRFYSGDRFYTLLNEYIDKNLYRKSKLMALCIQILFKSSNYKHDPGIANGQPLFVKLFDFFCILCLIVFFCFAGTLIEPILELATKGNLSNLLIKLSALGIGAFLTGVPGISWLIMYFTIRKKNKPLTLQAFVEKKITWCLKLRFLIKSTEKISNNKPKTLFLLENFEAQGASAPRWLNIQMINLVCSIFTDFNYLFRFESLNDEEYNELSSIIEHDFKMIDIISANDFVWNKYKSEIENENIFIKWSKKNKSK